MRWRTRLLNKRTGLLALCLGLLWLGPVFCSAATPWYANNLLTFTPASPGVNDPVVYDWSAVQAEITRVTPGTWMLKILTMKIYGPGGYTGIRQGLTNITQPWYFSTPGVYSVTLEILYGTVYPVVDPSGGPASYVHTCIAPAVTYVTLPPVSVAGAKQQPDGAFVYLTGKIVTYAGPEFVYIEEDDRSCGIRIEKIRPGTMTGMRVDIKGTLQTYAELERSIAAATLTQNGTGTVAAFAMPNKCIGGVSPDAFVRHCQCSYGYCPILG
ncbi:MAG: hypothetical protein WCL39_15510, partial [Armatimonadota bacterium]